VSETEARKGGGVRGGRPGREKGVGEGAEGGEWGEGGREGDKGRGGRREW
jgi:hypothetical protein